MIPLGTERPLRRTPVITLGLIGVNVAVFASPNVRGTLVDGRVSDFLDVARPSTRLLLEDAVPVAGTTRLYAVIIMPYRATSPAPMLTGLRCFQHDDRLVCSFSLDDSTYDVTWNAGSLAISR